MIQIATASAEVKPFQHREGAIKSLLTVNQLAEKHPAFSKASIRNMIFNATPRQSSRGTIPGNGLSKAIIRLGRKILIDEEKFFLWLDEQNKEAV